MRKILLIGAGLSTYSLIQYLIDLCHSRHWKLIIGDLNPETLEEQVKAYECVEAIHLDVFDDATLNNHIAEVDLVISMLPARFHIYPAKACLKHEKHFLVASYLTDELRELATGFSSIGKAFIAELGLDPGIDHMSAMKVLDNLRNNQHEILSFETFTGGLLAPESPNNPWQYKFTWNPRNVVLAGQGIVKFIQEGKFKYIPYHKLFRRTEIIEIPGHGFFEGYANRDSLKYRSVYKLEHVRTLYRGTLRRPGFCKAWDVFVQIGATVDSYEMEGVENMSHREFINSFLFYNLSDSVELKLAHAMHIDLDGEVMHKLKWLGIFSYEKVGLEKGTPAQILEHILKKKWTISPEDRDMIVMWHKFEFLENGEKKEIQSHMVVKGENQKETGMAKTVGLPLGIAAKLLLTGKLELNGLCLPIEKHVYEPVLAELEKEGIGFEERLISS